MSNISVFCNQKLKNKESSSKSIETNTMFGWREGNG